MGASEMYESHPIFELPADHDMQIWRYMDFTKFVAMLESDSLYFARADCLGDPFEAAYTKPMVEKYYVPKGMTEKEPRSYESYEIIKKRSAFEMAKQRLRSFYVNCWHINSGESAAMWKLYLKSDEGLAIQSTISRLIESANKSRETILIGKVRYIDYNNASFDDTNYFNQIIHKRESYKHEKELRAVIVKHARRQHYIEKLYGIEELYGIKTCYNMIDLIEKLYVAPGSPPWFSDLVSTIAKKYKITCEVSRRVLGRGRSGECIPQSVRRDSNSGLGLSGQLRGWTGLGCD